MSIFFIFFYEVQVVEIDLNNYIDKKYGEEDLLKIIKEKEREMFFTFEKKEERRLKRKSKILRMK